MKILHSDIHNFKGANGLKAHCFLWVAETDIHFFVIAKEMEDNPGTSTTNAVDELLANVKSKLRLTGKPIRWFEWLEHNKDPRAAFTEYANGSWRPSNEGDRKIIETILEQ